MPRPAEWTLRAPSRGIARRRVSNIAIRQFKFDVWRVVSSSVRAPPAPAGAAIRKDEPFDAFVVQTAAVHSGSFGAY